MNSAPSTCPYKFKEINPIKLVIKTNTYNVHEKEPIASVEFLCNRKDWVSVNLDEIKTTGLNEEVIEGFSFRTITIQEQNDDWEALSISDQRRILKEIGYYMPNKDSIFEVLIPNNIPKKTDNNLTDDAFRSISWNIKKK